MKKKYLEPFRNILTNAMVIFEKDFWSNVFSTQLFCKMSPPPSLPPYLLLPTNISQIIHKGTQPIFFQKKINVFKFFKDI